MCVDEGSDSETGRNRQTQQNIETNSGNNRVVTSPEDWRRLIVHLNIASQNVIRCFRLHFLVTSLTRFIGYSPGVEVLLEWVDFRKLPALLAAVGLFHSKYTSRSSTEFDHIFFSLSRMNGRQQFVSSKNSKITRRYFRFFAAILFTEHLCFSNTV